MSALEGLSEAARPSAGWRPPGPPFRRGHRKLFLEHVVNTHEGPRLGVPPARLVGARSARKRLRNPEGHPLTKQGESKALLFCNMLTNKDSIGLIASFVMPIDIS